MFTNDFSSFDDLHRLRRQMNDVFSEFDQHFGMLHYDPFFNDPFFNRERLEQPRQQRLLAKDPKAEEKYAAGGTEQKADTMNVESSTSPTAMTDTSGALTQAQPNSASALTRSRNNWSTFPRIHMPKCDVVENTDNYLVTCELPGMTKDDVKLSVNENGVLTISAERSSSSEQKDPQAKYHRVERTYGKFERSLPLPKNVELEQVAATHEHGLLKISLPKKKQIKAESPKYIQIQ